MTAVLHAALREDEIRRAVGLPRGGDAEVEGIATLAAPRDACLHFVVRAATPEAVRALTGLHGCIVLVPVGANYAATLEQAQLIAVADPRAAMAEVLGFVRSEGRRTPWVIGSQFAADAEISDKAVIGADVQIGPGAVIEPFATIGPDVSIGAGSVVRSGARINPHVAIGERTVIGNNAVIGSEGFGFVRDDAGDKVRIPHLGGIWIGSDVEIGALTVVQYGTITPTVIEDLAKIDDNVEVAHNTHVGRNASLVGGVVTGGSSVIGANAWIGINASIRNGRQVGAGALVGMDVSVQDDLPDRAAARAPRADVRSRPRADPS